MDNKVNWCWNFYLDDIGSLLIALLHVYNSNLNKNGVNFKSIFDFILENFNLIENTILRELFYAITGDNGIWYLGNIDFIYNFLHNYLESYYNITSYEKQADIIVEIEGLTNYDKFFNYLLENYSKEDLKEMFEDFLKNNQENIFEALENYAINLLENYIKENPEILE